MIACLSVMFKIAPHIVSFVKNEHDIMEPKNLLLKLRKLIFLNTHFDEDNKDQIRWSLNLF